MVDSSDFRGPYKQLTGQLGFHDLAEATTGSPTESPTTRSWGRNPLREQDMWRDKPNGYREHVGYFDQQGRKVLDTDKFSIPERAKPQGEQLGFDQVQAENAISNGAQIRSVQDLRNHVSKSFLPTDPVLHRLRQQNPKLNDYQFSLYGNAADQGGTHEVVANHRPFNTAIKPAIGRENITYDVGHLDWRNAPDLAPAGIGTGRNFRDDRTYGKIAGITVDEQHRGKGVAEGMYDYATAMHDKNKVATAPMHDSNRSMLGDIFARRVGGPLPRRTLGQDTYDYDV